MRKAGHSTHQKGRDDIGAIVLDMKEMEIDNLKCSMERKIDISEDRRSAVASAGTITPLHGTKRKMLLEPEKFLKDEAAILEILFPFPIPHEDVDRLLRDYISNFDIERILMSEQSYEIRRLSDLQA